MVDFRQDFDEVLNCNILRSMGASMLHRGPDQQGTYFSSGEIFLGLQHNRLAVIDVENGLQPMSAVLNGIKYTIVYNGEIYNTAELRDEITAELFRRTRKSSRIYDKLRYGGRSLFLYYMGGRLPVQAERYFCICGI